MHRPLTLVLAATVMLALAAPAPSGAYSHAHGADDESDFGWAIFSGGNSSMSDMHDLDSMDELKERFGDEFLYVRDRDDRYVITDRRLIARTQESTKQIRKYGKEIGELARAQARLEVDRALYEKRQTKRLTSGERRELARRREAASERLQKGVREIQEDVREILQEAMEKGLAEPLD